MLNYNLKIRTLISNCGINKLIKTGVPNLEPIGANVFTSIILGVHQVFTKDRQNQVGLLPSKASEWPLNFSLAVKICFLKNWYSSSWPPSTKGFY